MTIKHFKIFNTVCESEGITSAAAKLFMSQPAVSLAISEMESYYGVKLFDRISRKLFITHAGRCFHEYTEKILELYSEMERLSVNAGGTIRFGADLCLPHSYIPGIMKAFEKSLPCVTVNLAIHNSCELVRMVLCNELEFAVSEGVVSDSRIERFSLFDDKISLICPQEHPFAKLKQVKASDLKNEKFLLREHGNAERENLINALRAAGIEIVPSWEGGDAISIVKGVACGLGLSALSEGNMIGAFSKEAVSRFEIDNLTISNKFSIIYLKNKTLSAAAKEIISVIVNGEMEKITRQATANGDYSL